jgi:3-phenylpropionate/cinnamic acid dioxygenase small subunit
MSVTGAQISAEESAEIHDFLFEEAAQVSRMADALATDYALLDEGADLLRQRIQQLASPRLTYAENPPTLTRHIVSNIRIRRGNVANEYAVDACVLVYRNKASAASADIFAGERHDTLRRVGVDLRLAARLVRLDRTAFDCTNISTIF